MYLSGHIQTRDTMLSVSFSAFVLLFSINTTLIRKWKEKFVAFSCSACVVVCCSECSTLRVRVCVAFLSWQSFLQPLQTISKWKLNWLYKPRRKDKEGSKNRHYSHEEINEYKPSLVGDFFFPLARLRYKELGRGIFVLVSPWKKNVVLTKWKCSSRQEAIEFFEVSDKETFQVIRSKSSSFLFNLKSNSATNLALKAKKILLHCKSENLRIWTRCSAGVAFNRVFAQNQSP